MQYKLFTQPLRAGAGFTKSDIDGFFGLFIDNLIQLILIGTLCTGLLGMPHELIFGRILPDAAISIIFGNLFYSHYSRHSLILLYGDIFL